MAAEETSVERAVPSGGGTGRKLLVAGSIVAVLAAVGVAAAMFMTGSQPTETVADTEIDGQAPGRSAGPAIYTSLHPPMVVNLADSTGEQHFMQVTLEVMARKQDVITAVRDNAPLIRNSLILLYGSERYEDVVTRAGKEKMLADGLAEVRRVMKQQAGVSDIEALYFTNLIIQ